MFAQQLRKNSKESKLGLTRIKQRCTNASDEGEMDLMIIGHVSTDLKKALEYEGLTVELKSKKLGHPPTPVDVTMISWHFY